MSSFRAGRLLPQPPKSKPQYKIPLTNLRPHYLKPPNHYLGLIVCECTCVQVCVCVCLLWALKHFTWCWSLCTYVLVSLKPLTSGCVCVRAHAGDGQGFLEDGLAGKLGLYRHGYQPGGGGQGKFIIWGITECVCVCEEVQHLQRCAITKFSCLRSLVILTTNTLESGSNKQINNGTAALRIHAHRPFSLNVILNNYFKMWCLLAHDHIDHLILRIHMCCKNAKRLKLHWETLALK